MRGLHRPNERAREDAKNSPSAVLAMYVVTWLAICQPLDRKYKWLPIDRKVQCAGAARYHPSGHTGALRDDAAAHTKG